MGRSGSNKKIQSTKNLRSLILRPDQISFQRSKPFKGNDFNKMLDEIALLQVEALNMGKAAPLQGDFSKNKLSEINLSGLDFKDSSFKNSVGKSVIFSDKKMRIPARFENVDFSESVFSDSAFLGCNFKNADLRDATFSDSVLTDTNFTGADLRGAKMISNYFEDLNIGHFNCKMNSETSFAGSKFLNCLKPFSVPTNGASFFEVEFDGLTLEEHQDFSKSDFSKSVWHNSSAIAAVFNKSSFKEAVITTSNLAFSRFNKTNLQNAAIYDSVLRGGSFEEAEMTNLVVSSCGLVGAAFNNAKMNYLKAEWSNFSGADFIGADLSGAEFKNCNLTGIKMTKEIQDQVSFIDCQFS